MVVAGQWNTEQGRILHIVETTHLDRPRNVRLQAPFDLRVDRVMAREGLTDREGTEKTVAADDKARKKFVKMFYNHRWDNASDFDLVVDTGTISKEKAGDWILQASEELKTKQIDPNLQTTRDAEVDPLLLDAIEEALERSVSS